MVCTFFGHRECPQSIKEKLTYTLVSLIEDENANTFYVGNQGTFDNIVYSSLIKLKQKYPFINIYLVLPYIPTEKNNYIDYTYTVLPEGIEKIPKRFAISFCNNWMLDKADVILSFIQHDWGGAAQFVNKAKRKGKRVINMAE